MSNQSIAGTDITREELLAQLNAKGAYFGASIEPELHDRLLSVIDNMRHVLGMRQDEFAPLLGITRNAYSLAMSKRRMLSNVMTFIRFCYLFGYDFEQFTFSDVADRRDAAIHELAVRLGNLPDDLIRDFCETVSEDGRIGGHEAHALKVAFSSYQNLRAETVKACAAKPEENA